MRDEGWRLEFLGAKEKWGLLWSLMGTRKFSDVCKRDCYYIWAKNCPEPQDFSVMQYSETSDISHLQNFHPSSSSSACRATIFDVWEIPLQILYLL